MSDKCGYRTQNKLEKCGGCTHNIDLKKTICFMKRFMYDTLLTWKDRVIRMPLIIEGVRQCGKTWILKNFGEAEF